MSPLLHLPLCGVQWLEASAGTGKTYALTALYLRLVLERGLTPGQIPLLSFTRAASNELVLRVRARMRELEQRLSSGFEGDEHNDVLWSQWLPRLLAVSTRHELQVRLRSALLELDQAPIMTLHAFAQRVLQEHRLALGLSEAELREGSELERMGAFVQQQILRWSVQGALAWHPDLRNLVRSKSTLTQVIWSAVRAGRSVSDQAVDSKLQELVINGHSLAASYRTHPELSAWLARLPKRSTPGGPSLLDSRQLTELAQGFDAQPPRLSWTRKEVKDCLTASERRNAEPEPKACGFIGRLRHLHRQWADLPAARIVASRVNPARAALEAQARATSRQSFDEAIEQLLVACSQSHFVSELRSRFPAILVDEAQDTDRRQFQWLEQMRLSGADLFLVGDPKQSIYRFRGVDLREYFAFQRLMQAETSGLDQNFRSRKVVLDAIDSLFASVPQPFADDELGYRPVQASAERAHDCSLLADQPLAGINVCEFPAEAQATKERFAERAAEEIAYWLSANGARLGAERHPLRPSQIAVLAPRREHLTLMEGYLRRLGIPSLNRIRPSVFASEAAHDLRLLLLALTRPEQRGLTRALLLSPWLGFSSELLRRGEGIDVSAVLHQWRRTLAASGAPSLVQMALHQVAMRMHNGTIDARWRSDQLQLAELMAQARLVGSEEELQWLEQAIGDARSGEREQQLQLESEREAVQLMTIHAAKGLEFDVVFLPFVSERRRAFLDSLHWQQMVSDPNSWELQSEIDDPTRKRLHREELSERLRLLYVALTRARHALWLGFEARSHESSADDNALNYLLAQHHESESEPRSDRAALGISPSDPRLARWLARAEGSVALVPWNRADTPASGESELAVSADPANADHDRDRPQTDLPSQRVRARRAVQDEPSMFSFSRMTRSASPPLLKPSLGLAALPASSLGTSDLAMMAAAEFDPLRGEAFGTAMHAYLEQLDFAHWRGGKVSEKQLRRLAEVLHRHQVTPSPQVDAAVLRLAVWLHAALHRPVFGQRSLCSLQRHHYRAEVPFQLALGKASRRLLVDCIERHGFDASGFAQGSEASTREVLQGMLSGVIDLVAQVEGRFHILDYKTNWLGPEPQSYDQEHMLAAVSHHHYHLQGMLYACALWRWLRQRMGRRFAPEKHLGSTQLLFLRGCEADQAETGLYRVPLPLSLISALDGVLSGGVA